MPARCRRVASRGRIFLEVAQAFEIAELPSVAIDEGAEACAKLGAAACVKTRQRGISGAEFAIPIFLEMQNQFREEKIHHSGWCVIDLAHEIDRGLVSRICAAKSWKFTGFRRLLSAQAPPANKAAFNR